MIESPVLRDFVAKRFHKAIHTAPDGMIWIHERGQDYGHEDQQEENLLQGIYENNEDIDHA